MEPNKIYESIVELLYNVIKNEKLRYELTKDADFKNQIVNQINNILFLEKENAQNYNNVQWATTFAKAIVKITNEKQRFEKPEQKKSEDIYAEYSSFISYVTKTFEIGRNELVESKIKFTEQDVMFISIMNDEIKAKYKLIEDEKIAAEKAVADAEKKSKSNNQNNNYSNNNFNQAGQNPFGGNGFNAQDNYFSNMPVHPMQDPRFYPYNIKRKWMPIAKYIIAAFTIFTTLFLIVTMAMLMSTKIDFSGSNYVSDYTNGAFLSWQDIFKSDFKDTPTALALAGVSFQTIMSYFFFILPSIYIGVSAFRKPRSMRDKYRIGLWPVIFTIIFFTFEIVSLISYVDSNHIKTSFGKILKIIVDPEKAKETNLNAFWNVVMNNYGSRINTLTLMADLSIAFLSLSIVVGGVILALNPRLDRNKIAFANMEFQKAAAAMMQGQNYTMDQSLYENDDEVINSKETKFSKWWNDFIKKFKKKK
ncbi:hypothetical protein ESOMN_v1c03820 [Williamsoniiplasma somnilux]|uniref:Uncharacterized protein n=1 Tax=Williamsoniiplasma somnilux TaxID=215578 RepID=A0A2K8NYE1_9MOLU|nr:hypothetical protein [Williamsoniiplasma somnilux]ATZ18764.1 hypothetical protein ESOMN_v1c03820 [Williamsoniiplasma somnilux]